MDFKKLWQQRLKSILEQIATGETDYEEVANLAEHIGADYHGRFLVELLQNAEDQTTKAGISDGLAVVVRTEKLIGVLNQGVPFHDHGVRSITSAGISPKKAEESIGNKGVGFKAVFQVSSTPEIFSAAEDGKLTAAGRVAFRINHDLFGNRSLREHMETTTREVLRKEPDLQTRLESQLGPGEMWPKLLDCLRRVAPFKFPQSLGDGDFEAQCESLSVPIRLFNRMSTLVVLPLIRDESTPKVVEQALDELVAADVPGSALLFLQGIGRLRVYDFVRESAWLLARRQHGETCRLAKGAMIVPVSTTSYRVDVGGYTRSNAEWWQIRRRFGREGDDAESRSEEEVSIKDAVARLPGGLRKVRTSYAAVAVPRVPTNQLFPKRFLVVGRMCIGLPSRMATGTPAWLDGPFHGNVARTKIDLGLESQPYNRLIFEECLTLFWQAVEYVKTMGGIGSQRGILFWFDFEQGALARHFRDNKQVLASADVVLSYSKDGFLSAECLRLPEEIEGSRFESLFGHVPNLECFGFRLPDPWLLGEGREILDSLAGQPCRTNPIFKYIKRSENCASLIEMASLLRRKAGPDWWEPFLDWLTEQLSTERLSVEKVRDQAVLPVLGPKLASSEDRVFLRPHQLPVGESGESDEGEEVIDNLDPTLATSLRLLDEDCVRVRVADRPRDLTDLARKLSPDGPTGLVRRPRRPELINDVIAPALSERTQRDPRDTLCVKLLACAGEWLRGMSERDRARVNVERLLVPTSNDDAQWEWRPAEEVYLGRGWVDDQDHQQLLDRAYGRKNGPRLPSWGGFSGWIQIVLHSGGELPDRDVWRGHMEVLGVNAQPRILVHKPRQGYFKSWSYKELSLEYAPPCPFPQVASFWSQYLDHLRRRSSNTCSGQPFFARPLSWIDGLEDPDARETVMELVLKYPDKYEKHIETRVERQNGSDGHNFPSFWMWAIQTQRWAVVPSNDGPRPVDSVWILHKDQRRSFVDAKLLVVLPEQFYRNCSHGVITALGVHSPDNAPVERIASELHRAAERLPVRDQEKGRAIKVLIQTLYEWLNERCETYEYEFQEKSDLECLLRRPLPLVKGEHFEPVDMKDASCIYLNDDPQRSPYITGFTDGYALPISAKSGFKALFQELRNLLGNPTCQYRVRHFCIRV